MKKIALILTLFLSLSSYGQTKDIEIESILLECLVESYMERQVDINHELDKLEKYLIDKEYIKSSAGQAYFDFNKKITELNDIPVTLDYETFKNIYILTPNQVYSVDCLERLKQFDSATVANSKYSHMTIAIQHETPDEISPSSISKAITSVLSPSDFDKEYYRAIALLAIAYTANPIGLERQLETNDNKNYTAYQSIMVSTTEKDQILLNGKEVTQDELRATLTEFIKTNKSNHLIRFQADMGTSYDFYLKVQDQITLVYTEIRNELALEKYNQTLKDLTDDQKNEIKRIYPTRIKE